MEVFSFATSQFLLNGVIVRLAFFDKVIVQAGVNWATWTWYINTIVKDLSHGSIGALHGDASNRDWDEFTFS